MGPEGRRSIGQTGPPSRHLCSLWPPSMDTSPQCIHFQALFLLGPFHSHQHGPHGQVLPARAGSPMPPANPKSTKLGSAELPAILTTTPSPSSRLYLILLLLPGDLCLWILGWEHCVPPISPWTSMHPDQTLFPGQAQMTPQGKTGPVPLSTGVSTDQSSSLVRSPSVDGREKKGRPPVSIQKVGTPKEAMKNFCTK